MNNPFTDHPAKVGESFGEHFLAATSFGLTMMVAGFACILHGIFPFAFTTTGSDAVRALHERMCRKRADKLRADPMMQNIEWVI